MGGRRRLAFQGAGDDSFHMRIADLARLAGTRFIEQSVHIPRHKPLPPLAHRLDVNPQL